MPSLSIPISTSVEIDFECECQECGETLDSEVVEISGHTTVRVQKCPTCPKADVMAGVYKGEEYGYDKGVDQGREDGFKEGHTDGYESGYNDGQESMTPEPK